MMRSASPGFSKTVGNESIMIVNSGEVRTMRSSPWAEDNCFGLELQIYCESRRENRYAVQRSAHRNYVGGLCSWSSIMFLRRLRNSAMPPHTQTTIIQATKHEPAPHQIVKSKLRSFSAMLRVPVMIMPPRTTNAIIVATMSPLDFRSQGCIWLPNIV